jgi:hypothetical protein
MKNDLSGFFRITPVDTPFLLHTPRLLRTAPHAQRRTVSPAPPAAARSAVRTKNNKLNKTDSWRLNGRPAAEQTFDDSPEQKRALAPRPHTHPPSVLRAVR